MAQPTFVTIVVDPSILRRENLVGVLNAAGFNVTVAAPSIAEVVHGPPVGSHSILLVLQASGDHDAMLTQIQLLRARHPGARIALLQKHGQLRTGDIFAAFEAGVDAYFAEPSRSTFIKSLELVMQGDEMAVRAAFRRSSRIASRLTTSCPSARTVSRRRSRTNPAESARTAVGWLEYTTPSRSQMSGRGTGDPSGTS